jgi:Kelch motif
MVDSFFRTVIGIAITGLIGAGGAQAQSSQPQGYWTFKTPMPVARAEVSAAAVGGKLYALGGNIGGTAVPHNFEYDPTGDSWRQRSPMPVARDHLAVVAAEGKIHVIGGRLGATVDKTGQHDVYDPATNSWSAAAPLLTPRSAPASVVYRGMILVLGGELAPLTYVENEGYDLKGGKWVSLAAMPAGRHGFGGGVIGSNAYFVGGSLKPGVGQITDQLIMFTLP